MMQGVFKTTHTSMENRHLNFAFRRFNSSLLSLQYFGYYFLLFNQERPHNPENISRVKNQIQNILIKLDNLLFSNTAMTETSTIGTVDFLLSQWHPLSLMSSSWSNTSECGLAHTTLWNLPLLLFVLINQTTTWSSHTGEKKNPTRLYKNIWKYCWHFTTC